MPLTGSNLAQRQTAALFGSGTSLSVFCEVAGFDWFMRCRTPSLNSVLKDFSPAKHKVIMSKKQLLAFAVAISVLGVPMALAAPASAATSVTTTSPVFTDRDHKDKDDKDDEDEDDGWGHEDNHSLPPVVIRPHGDDDDDEDGDHEDGDHEDEEGEEEGDDDEGGFVVPTTPGVDASTEPSPSPYVSNSNDTANGASYSVSPLIPLVTAGSPTAPLETRGGEQVVGANTINPDAAPAIDPASIRTSAKTPADVFMESATWGLVAMGAGALALGSVAGVKTLSARRKPEGEYFYDSEN
jgi:Ni/Co efflux regulator RcnB